MAKKLDHVAVAVPSIDEALPFYRDALGLDYRGKEEVADQGVKVGVFIAGEVRVELLEPTSPGSSVAKFLDKRGAGLHHIALAVDDIKAELARLASANVSLIDASPRKGAGGALIAFIHPGKAGVLVELVER